METPQDKIREFFWELDKLLGPNHPFIVLHGPADTFRRYLERNIEDTNEMEEIKSTNWGLESEIDKKIEEIDDYRTTIEDAIDDLKKIKPDEHLDEEIDEAISRVIQDLKDVL